MKSFITAMACLTLLSSCGFPEPQPGATEMGNINVNSSEWNMASPTQKEEAIGAYN